jgi:microcystin-dependent protein
MSNYEATKYDFSGANLTGIEGIPTATIVPWSDSSVPTGFLECNGAAVSRSTYSALFAIIGTTYGAGDGATTFLVPDLQDNVAIGKSGTKALASTGGANTVAASGTVGGSTANATISIPQLAAHTHSYPSADQGGNPTQNFDMSPFSTGRLQLPGGTVSSSTGSGTGHSHNMSATFTGSATSVVQPYLALIYIIKT